MKQRTTNKQALHITSANLIKSNFKKFLEKHLMELKTRLGSLLACYTATVVAVLVTRLQHCLKEKFLQRQKAFLLASATAVMKKRQPPVKLSLASSTYFCPHRMSKKLSQRLISTFPFKM